MILGGGWSQQPKASFDPIAAKSSSPAADPYNNLGTWAVEFVEPHGKILENHLPSGKLT